MSLEPMAVPEENGSIQPSMIDTDPETADIIHLSKDRKKGEYKYETFVEQAPKRSFWGTPKGNQTLVHLSRRVAHVSGGYNLTDVAMRTLDLVTGEVLSEVSGKKAVKAAQQLEDVIPYRLHNIDPKGMNRREDNWLMT